MKTCALIPLAKLFGKLTMFLVPILLFSCNHNYSANPTEIFVNYLKNVHQLSPATGKALYFIVPTSSCIGCSKLVLEEMKKMSNQNCYIITTPAHKDFFIDINMQGGLLLDTLSIIDRLDLGIANASLISVYNSEITDIRTIIPPNSDSSLWEH